MSAAINSEVDRLLAEHRPDRYEVDGGDEWLDDVADLVESLIPEAEARAIAARQFVRRREGIKTKSTNRLLREITQSHQLPLDWFELMNLPLAVGKERVALRACRSEDFRAFAAEERRRTLNDMAARNETCEATEWLADQMDATGTEYARDLDLDEGEEDAA
jgi:hypothetical protein